MSFKEMIELKDEILKNNRELEKNLKSQIEQYTNEFVENISVFKQRITSISEINNKIVNSLPEIKFQISKIDAIEKFDKRTDNRISTHEARLMTIMNEIEKIKTKYDKIFIDNMTVPGYVGGHCKYVNLSEYLTFNINEVSLLKFEIEQLKKDTKNLKNKQDYTIKQIVNLVDGSVRRCNEYTDNKQKDFQLLLDTKMTELNEKVMEIRMNVYKIQMKTEEDINNLKNEFKNIIEEKVQFTNMFENKLLVMEDEFGEFQKTYKTNMDEVKEKNNTFEKDINNIKGNIEYLIKLIQSYQKKQNINNNYNLDILESALGEFDAKNKNFINKSTRQKKKRNTVYGNSPKKNNELKIRRSFKKRNTMICTTPILKLQIKNKMIPSIKDIAQVPSPTFLGLINQISHKIIKTSNEVENHKNNLQNDEKTKNIKNEFNYICKELNQEDNKDNNTVHSQSHKINKSKNNSDILGEDFSSMFESDSDSLRNDNNKSHKENKENDKNNNDDDNDKNEFHFSRNKKKSKSKKYFSKLSLKSNYNNINEEKKSQYNYSKKLEKNKLETILNHNQSHYKRKKLKKQNTNKKSENNDKNNINLEYIDNETEKSFSQSNKEKISSLKFDKIKNKEIKNIMNNQIILNDNKYNNNTARELNKKIIVNEFNKKIITDYNDDTKNNINTFKINLKNDNLTKSSNSKFSNKKHILKKNESDKNKQINNNKIIQTLFPISKSLNSYNNITMGAKNIIYKNNYSNTINAYSAISKNHKVSHVISSPKEYLNKNMKNMENITPIQKKVEIDSDTGIGYKIVSFDIPENTSLPQKTYQLYALFGKKIQKKNQIKTETISPLDDLFKRQFNKNARKLRLDMLSNSNMMNDIPKKISPIFGRTAYAFYTKKEIEGFGGSVNNSLRMKGNNIINIANNNIPLDIKFISNGKK